MEVNLLPTSSSGHSQQENSNSPKTAIDMSRCSILTRGTVVAGEFAGNSVTNFGGQVRRAEKTGAFFTEPDSPDWALLRFPDNFDLLPNKSNPWADVQEVIIKGFEREKDLGPGKVFTEGGKGGMISGRLREGLALVSLRGHRYDVKRIHTSGKLGKCSSPTQYTSRN